METAAETVIDDDWRDLSTHQRDIIVTLAVVGGATGTRIHALRGRDADTEPTTHRNLSALRQRGLIESSAVDGDDRARENRLTEAGQELFARGVVGPAVETGVVHFK